MTDQADRPGRPLRLAASEYRLAREAQEAMNRLEEQIARLRQTWTELRAERDGFLAVIDRMGFTVGECGAALLESLDPTCASHARAFGLPGDDLPTRDDRAAGR